jgi:hypothetical protein
MGIRIKKRLLQGEHDVEDGYYLIPVNDGNESFACLLLGVLFIQWETAFLIIPENIIPGYKEMHIPDGRVALKQFTDRWWNLTSFPGRCNLLALIEKMGG